MSTPDHFAEIASRFVSRRDLLRGAATIVAGVSALGSIAMRPARAAAPALAFTELARIGKDTPTHHVAPGYRADILIGWGDPILPGAPAFDPRAQTAEAQKGQFGFNCDFIGYLPLKEGARSKAEHLASGESGHGLLCVNHEYTIPHLMFPGIGGSREGRAKATAQSVAVERASLGHSVVEIRRTDGIWAVVAGSALARRIHADTEMEIAGPARGHARMKTPADPEGVRALGTMSNCAGGVTPWGTVLTAEENIQNYFVKPTDLPADYWREAESADSFGVWGGISPWGSFEPRFDISRTPHEFNRFGWIVEIDPYDPQSIPRKRTALGRFKHEAATIVAAHGKPVVAYMGDDQPLEFVYKFVSERIFDARDPLAASDALDHGVLYVACFADDGAGAWLPLIHGQGPLTAENGFEDQGDVAIDARRAARLLGATPTDRPEDVETDPLTSRTYIAFTGGTTREAPGPAAPRAPNQRGHIVEILAPGVDGARDHAADRFEWDILLLAGHAGAEASAKGVYGAGTTEAGYFAQPDNLAFDPMGRLWVATDGAGKIGLADGLWGCCVTGPERAVTRHFFAAPRGAETCGPCFTPDGATLFLAVQHPGDDGGTFDAPTTRWPAGPDSDMPPRPSIVAVTREGGGTIGS